MSEPEQVEVRAIDIHPYEAAIWCTIADSEPFANTIEHRGWSEDGERIWFMLGSHNFYDAKPDDMVSVVLCTPAYAPPRPFSEQYDNEVFLAARPKPKHKCPHCEGSGFLPGHAP